MGRGPYNETRACPFQAQLSHDEIHYQIIILIIRAQPSFLLSFLHDYVMFRGFFMFIFEEHSINNSVIF